MADTDMATQLAELISDILGQEVSPTALDASLVEGYGANSMDAVDIVIRIERKFKVKIDNSQLPQMKTFGDILKLVQASDS